MSPLSESLPLSLRPSQLEIGSLLSGVRITLRYPSAFALKCSFGRSTALRALPSLRVQQVIRTCIATDPLSAMDTRVPSITLEWGDLWDTVDQF